MAPHPDAPATSTPASVIRRFPFTIAMLATFIIVGILTTTAWTPAIERPWYPSVAFGWQSLGDGHLWTLATGAFLAVTPGIFLFTLFFIAGGIGLAEWLIGTRRTILVVIATHVIGVLVGSFLIWVLSVGGWTWARATMTEYDVGPSAGAIGAAVVASAFLRPVWRWRLRLLLFAFIATSLVFLGYLSDLIHLVAFLIALPAGTLMAGRRVRVRMPAITRREVRRISAGFYFLSATLAVLGALVDRMGPLGEFGGDSFSVGLWISVAVDVIIALGLLKGRRGWWRFALAIQVFEMVLVSLVVLLVAFAGVSELRLGAVFWINVLFGLAQVTVLILGRASFHNPSRRGVRRGGSSRIGGLPTETDHRRAREIVSVVGSTNNLSWIGTWDENHWWFPVGEVAVVTYQKHAGVAIGLGDPVCREGRLEVVADAFVAAARDVGLTPCFFSSTAAVKAWAESRNWVALQVASEAVIDLPELEFRGKKWQDVRSALNQAPKNGIVYSRIRLADAPRHLRAQVEHISQQWVGEKELPEMGFTLGGVEEALDPETWVCLATDEAGKLHGVVSWLPAHAPGGAIAGWTLDLMRRAPESFRYTMEFLIASSCLQFKEEGYQFMSLSGAPLAGLEDEGTALSSVVARLADAVEPFYAFGTLERFKSKFMPRGVPLYLVASDEAAMAKAGVAVARAYLAHATPLQIVGAMRPR